MSYAEDKARKRIVQMERRLGRIMAAPPSRGETLERSNQLLMNVLSVATALESLERLLIEKGILYDDELMTDIAALTKQKAEQIEAARLTAPSEEAPSANLQV